VSEVGVDVGIGDVVLSRIGSWKRRLGGWFGWYLIIVELKPGLLLSLFLRHDG